MNIVQIFKKTVNTHEKKTLFENFVALSVLQGANYILPLITLPYLVRVLGPERFGLVAFAQAFVGYFQILTNYGFNLSSTREISIFRNDLKKISEIFSAVFIIQLLLLLLSFVLLSIIIIIFAKFRADSLLYFFTFGIIIGNVLFPAWFFQGVESMKYITVLNVIAKLIFTVAIFIFIRNQNDYIYVALLNSLGFIIAGIIALWIIFYKFKIEFKIPHISMIKHQLTQGWYIFLSTVAISLYTISNTFILGLLTNNTIVGYYSGAEKIIKAIQGLMGPLNQSIYPYMSKIAQESKEKLISFAQKLVAIIGIIGLIGSIMLYIVAGFIVKILLGPQYYQSILVLRILSFVPLIVALSNIFGIQVMLPLGFNKAFSNILVIASLMNILLLLLFIPHYFHLGTAFSVVITELFVTITMYVYLVKKQIKLVSLKHV